MGETTGAFFSYAVEFSLDYHREHPRYQPFSVYEDYPGRAFLTASSCDEFVWALLSAAQERGVSLTPALMPQKHKIVIYSQTEPETVSLDGRGGGGVMPGGDGGNGSASSSETEARSAWSSSSLSSLPSPSPSPSGGPAAGEGDGGPGGGGAGGSSDAGGGENAGDAAVGNGNGTSGSGETGVRRDRARRSLRGALAVVPEVVLEVQPPWAARAPANALTVSAGNGRPPGTGKKEAGGARGGGEGVAAAILKGAASLEPPDRVLVANGVRVGARNAQEEGAGAGDGPGATLVPGTVQPTVVPAVMPTEAIDPAEPAAEGDWQQVVAYYQSLQLCLQERKFSFVTSLKDFAQYFDCLDDVAFIHVGPHEYKKVNLTSTRLDHISLPEELPALMRNAAGFTLVDTLLAIWILMILACGVHGMLWQAALIQHWIKSSGCGQDEDLPPDEDHPELLRHPSFGRQVATEYLRLGERFLGKIGDYPSSETGATPTNSLAEASADEVVSPCRPSDRDFQVDVGKKLPSGVVRKFESMRNGGGRKGGGHARVGAADGGDIRAAAGGGGEEEEEGGARRGRGGSRRGRRVVKGDGERLSAGEEEEEGVEMRVAGVWPVTSGASEGRGQDQEREDEGEELAGTFVGSSRSPGARTAGVPGSPPSPCAGEGRQGSPSSPPSSSWPVGEPRAGGLKSRRTREAYGGGGGDRWIGFAGSPRLQPTGDGTDRNFSSDDVRIRNAGGGAGPDAPSTDLLRTSGLGDGRDLGVVGPDIAVVARRGGGESGGRDESKASREGAEDIVLLHAR